MNCAKLYKNFCISLSTLFILSLFGCDEQQITAYTITPDDLNNKCLPGYVEIDSKCLEIICIPGSISCCDSNSPGCENGGIRICQNKGTTYEIVQCDPSNPQMVDVCPSQCITECPEGTVYNKETKQCITECPEGTVYNKETKQCDIEIINDDDLCPPDSVKVDGECKKIICEPNTYACCDSNYFDCMNGEIQICDKSGTYYFKVLCDLSNPEMADACPSQCIPDCPDDNIYDVYSHQCIPIPDENSCLEFVDPEVERFAIGRDGWDTNHDGCISISEANAVTTLRNNSFKNNEKLKTLEDLNQFKNLKYFETYSISLCPNLQKIQLNYAESFDTYSFDQNKNLETLILPRARKFKNYFGDAHPKLKQLFLTTPGNIDYVTYSFLALTKDVRVDNWYSEWDNSNKDVTLYLSRDKLSKHTPRIISPNRWGSVLMTTNRDYYYWKAIYVCDDYATDTSSCELVTKVP